jgi:RNA polymerase primary sigma factor
MAENVFDDRALQQYLNEIASIPTLSREDEYELALRAQVGNQDAVQRLIRANLKFVVKIASHYQNRGLSLSELISEGNMGLIKAIEKFDASKNIKLISYAVWWIKQRILFALAEKSSLIRMPLGKANTANKIRVARERIFNRTGKAASMDEIEDETSLKGKEIDNIDSHQVDTLSLEDFSHNYRNNDFPMQDLLEDTEGLDPKSIYYREKIQNKIEESIHRLPERDAHIIRSYFGIGGDTGKNFAQIAEELGLSRERVRQIQKTALKQIFKETFEDYEKDIDFLINTNV